MTKPTKWLHTEKTQISLGIRPVWSESLLCAQWVAKGPRFLHVDGEDSDQTGWMPRLIWDFAGCTCHFVGFVMRRLIFTVGGWILFCLFSMYIYIYIWTSSSEFGTYRLCEQRRFRRACTSAQLARTSAARSYKQWVKRNLQTESQIPGPSEWLGMRS